MTLTERWPAILLQLDPDGWTRASDLARTLGVSERTVYRDVRGMVEAGVPLQGVPGKGYRLPEEYMLDPVRLTTDEAVMLVLGSAYAAQNFGGRYRAAAQAAEQKIAGVLSSDDRERASALQNNAHLVPPSAFESSSEGRLRDRVRRALLEQRSIVVRVRESGGELTRRLDPYGLVRRNRTWHVVGYGRDRDRVVHVRLTDVAELEVTDTSFDRPASYTASADGVPAGPERRVRVLFDADVAPSVQVVPSLDVADRELLSDGRLLLTLNVYDELDVLPWLLSWGAHVQVLEPTALRERLAAEAQAVADQYESAPTLLD